MTTSRAYSRAKTIDQAMRECAQLRGRQCSDDAIYGVQRIRVDETVDSAVAVADHNA